MAEVTDLRPAIQNRMVKRIRDNWPELREFLQATRAAIIERDKDDIDDVPPLMRTAWHDLTVHVTLLPPVGANVEVWPRGRLSDEPWLSMHVIDLEHGAALAAPAGGYLHVL